MEKTMNCVLPFICLLAFVMAVLVHNCDSLVVVGEDMLPLGASLTGNQTIISKNGTFQLGFFNPNGTNNWYIGIWYAQVSDKTIIWVANREDPVVNIPGILKLETDGYLTLFDRKIRIIWSSYKNQKVKASRAFILDSGNFLMVSAQNTSEIVWESFGDPTDTLLPGMKLWKGMKLTSWKSSIDPAPGPFSEELNPSPGKAELLMLYNNTIPYWRGGEESADGVKSIHPKGYQPMYKEHFQQISPTSMYFTYTIKSSLMVRQVLHKNGGLMIYGLIDNKRWRQMWWVPKEVCDVYDICGAYGLCNSDGIQSCSCLDGFKPSDEGAWSLEQWWSSGCARLRPLQCSVTNGTTDGFRQLTDKSLPDEKAVSYSEERTQKACRSACLKNCSCTAFAFNDNTYNPSFCRLWFGDLLNMRHSSQGPPLFIRLAASELKERSRRRRSRIHTVLVSVAVAVAASVIVFIFIFIRWNRRRLHNKHIDNDMIRTFSYKELKIATKNFSNKLGSGAFGSVFKGTLADNTIVAVKKLESSVQGEKQFRAEISTIGNIQHVNLVRLRGFCTQGSQRLLVYEYMPNGSLNSLLSRNSGEVEMVLDWETRFEIAMGIAKGLIYLHEECRDRIIHCDIKPENILLDSEFCPKVADFGLAKLVRRDLSEVLTTTRGTRGYLAPEWISGLPITAKVDVYSFGMMLLEIMSGRRNLDLTAEEPSRYYFPSWSATQIVKGNNIMDIVDERIANDADVEEVRRAVLVSMLCIQENENLRPSMGEVLLVLEGKTEINTNKVERSLQVFLEEHAEIDHP
ncbi:hypothetical protein KI387_034079 [Taxus chinensis]|uniref:Receptor-like serine/threonine-protein kinase n=1 Tax=Taxus chinensis TaxID=29808 RepID=A0AA38F6C5_TAXCH|nr:hypothetical protein KI387_034079 [Taxus chinensis]